MRERALIIGWGRPGTFTPGNGSSPGIPGAAGGGRDAGEQRIGAALAETLTPESARCQPHRRQRRPRPSPGRWDGPAIVGLDPPAQEDADEVRKPSALQLRGRPAAPGQIALVIDFKVDGKDLIATRLHDDEGPLEIDVRALVPLAQRLPEVLEVGLVRNHVGPNLV